MTPSSSGRALRAARAAAVCSSGAFRISASPLGPVARITALAAAAALMAPAAALAQSPAQQVVITANRTPQPLASVLADLTVIDRSEIERAGVASVADVLARQPGIEISRNGGPAATTSVFIRGSENRHTAVYIDGVRVDSQSVGGVVWEQIPLDQIERIELLRGPAAAIYGSDAVAGVVQLFTRRGQGAARPTASLTLGSHDTVQAAVGVSGSQGTLNYALSASHGRSDGFNATTPDAWGHNPDADGWRRTSVQGRAGLQIDAVHRIDVALLASKLDADYDGTSATDDQNRHTLRSANVSWQGRWNAQATTRVQLGQTRSTYESQPSFYRTETTLDNLTVLHEQRLGQHVLTGTLERRADDLFNPATDYTAALSGDRHQDALGLGWRTEIGRHALQAHVRHDQDSEFGGKSTGGLAWGWQFLPQWRVTASVATSFRVPTLYQRFSEYGTASLVPESGRNVELGLRWAHQRSEASLSAWRNTVSNLIAFDAPGLCANSYGCYENVGQARLQGVTLAGRTQVAAVALRGSLDWHDPRNTELDTVLQRRARRTATFGADAQLAGWSLGAEVRAVGQRFENVTNSQILGGYTLVNLVVSRPLTRSLTLQARIDNVGDKRYEFARNYLPDGRSGQVSLHWAL